MFTKTAMAACSTYAGSATFNEYYFGGDANFLEVYIKNVNQLPRSDWQGWTLRVYESSAVYTDYLLNDSTSTYCEFGSKAYITHYIPAGLPSTPVSIALLDASGNEIDYLDACGPPDICSLPGYYTPDPGACSTADHDVKLDNLGNRDIGRFPDGSGNWSDSSGTGSGTSYSSCATNNAGVAKYSDTASVALDANFTFTINTVNNGKSNDAYTVTDNMPAGFTYVSSTPSQGTVNVSALPLLTWDVGTLAKNGGSASLTITVTGSVLGSHQNTATLVAPCTDPGACPADSATVLVEAASATEHFAIAHDGSGVNCQSEPVTISAHAKDHSVDTGHIGTLNLSTSTGHGDWAVITGLGALNNGAADDGAASYSMVAGDNGMVVLGLKDTHVETLNINVSDGVFSETSGAVLASEDQNLAFAQSGFVFLADGVANSIGTQIAGKFSAVSPGAQLIELQAIRTSDTTGACEAALQGVNGIDMAFECRNPSSCSAMLVNVNGGVSTNIPGNPLGAIGSYTPVSLDFGNATDSTASFVMNYPDAGQIQLHARYIIPLDDGSGTPSGIYMNGGSNAFVVRPFGFDIDFSGDRAANGITGASYAANATGSIFHLAGTAFDTSLTAVAWSSADDTNNDGVPDACANLTNNAVTANFGSETVAVIPSGVTLSQSLVEPSAGGVPGALTTSANSAAFVAGTGNKTIAWSEVGIMKLSANLVSYLGSGQAVQGNVCNVGRFYPKDFVIANAAVTNRSDIALCADPFTYMDENFKINFDLQAYNAATPPAITQNYIGVFAKLDPTALGAMNYGATDSGSDYTTRLGASSAGAFTGGVAPVAATLVLAKNAAPDGLYANIEIGIAPADSDGVSLRTLNLSLNGGPSTHGKLGQTDIRHGRLILRNNFGSELLPLTMPLLAQHYLNSTTGFVTNTDDNCTALTTADILLYNDQAPKTGRVLGNAVINVSGATTTTLTGVSAFANGVSSLNFSTPGEEGYVNAEVQTPAYLLSNIDGIDQGAQGPGAHCTPGLAVSEPAYIAACAADGNADDDVPIARGNFGIFKGSDRVIYIREVY